MSDEIGTKECKKCPRDATVMLHGRFPFCDEHYLEVIHS